MTAEKKPGEMEKLAAENARLRGDLLTIAHRIAHDLRTPLGGVISSGEVLKEMISDEGAVAVADSLLHSAEELGVLIRRVSFVTKASARPVEKETVNMGLPVSNALQQLESRLLKKGAVVKEPSDWPQVSGVTAWLEVIWWNLIANAIQHGGRSIELGWREADGKFYFWVADDGAGAAENATLFVPFHTLHEMNRTRGLGLSIVQRLVELQGGECGYEIPGGGSRFFFTMPG